MCVLTSIMVPMRYVKWKGAAGGALLAPPPLPPSPLPPLFLPSPPLPDRRDVMLDSDASEPLLPDTPTYLHTGK